MGRASCCPGGEGIKRGTWTAEEDHKLKAYVESHGEGGWRSLPPKAGLERCGKSCRLRWNNYLKPGIKRGSFTPQEDQTIIKLHAHLGNRWAAIARQLPTRTDNDIKNYWNAHLKKRLAMEGQAEEGGEVELETVPVEPPAKKRALSSSAQILNRLATRATLLRNLKTCILPPTPWVPDSSGSEASYRCEYDESGNDEGSPGQWSKSEEETAAAAAAGNDDDDDDDDQWGLLLDSDVAGFPAEFPDSDTLSDMAMGGSPFSDSRFLEDSFTPPPTP